VGGWEGGWVGGWVGGRVSGCVGGREGGSVSRWEGRWCHHLRANACACFIDGANEANLYPPEKTMQIVTHAIPADGAR
jgi:hypothetical protein